VKATEGKAEPDEAASHSHLCVSIFQHFAAIWNLVHVLVGLGFAGRRVVLLNEVFTQISRQFHCRTLYNWWVLPPQRHFWQITTPGQVICLL